MLARLWPRIEPVVTNLVSAAIFAVVIAVGLSIWAATLSVPIPVIVASAIAAVGGVLGLTTFANRHLPPRPIEVEYLGLLWQEKLDSSSGGVRPTLHRASA